MPAQTLDQMCQLACADSKKTGLSPVPRWSKLPHDCCSDWHAERPESELHDFHRGADAIPL